MEKKTIVNGPMQTPYPGIPKKESPKKPKRVSRKYLGKGGKR